MTKEGELDSRFSVASYTHVYIDRWGVLNVIVNGARKSLSPEEQGEFYKKIKYGHLNLIELNFFDGSSGKVFYKKDSSKTYRGASIAFALLVKSVTKTLRCYLYKFEVVTVPKGDAELIDYITFVVGPMIKEAMK